MQGEKWIVRPQERKQISLVKIPSEIASKLNIKDGEPISVKIFIGGTDIYKGPLTVTSGQELYIPKNVRNLLKNEKEFILTIIR
ncbi:MAG: hypothetical protein OIN86_16660 [Candidatus Methanoperedens sp.]|nr:hypothetical protein [Candidatus Methanoperedens sp.]CAG1003497.1 hypothetical protein METP1_03079 [Methanosarcinales archaeon]